MGETRLYKVKYYAVQGLSQAEIARRENISRAGVYYLLKKHGFHSVWKRNRAQIKQGKTHCCIKCKTVIPLQLKYCKKHTPYSRTNDKCINCKRKTEPGKRAKGYCLPCYHKVK